MAAVYRLCGHFHMKPLHDVVLLAQRLSDAFRALGLPVVPLVGAEPWTVTESSPQDPSKPAALFPDCAVSAVAARHVPLLGT